VIGPSDAGADVNVIVSRARPDETAAPARDRAGPGSTSVGYAHINRWSLNDGGAVPNGDAARVIAGELERQPGFVSYALVRTGAREVVAVTIFETEAQLRRAMDTVAPLVRRHVLPLATARPERREGAVLHYRAAR
jgi:heme-degrading monooxygenase HmoA